MRWQLNLNFLGGGVGGGALPPGNEMEGGEGRVAFLGNLKVLFKLHEQRLWVVLTWTINKNIIHCVGITKSSSLKNRGLCLNSVLL